MTRDDQMIVWWCRMLLGSVRTRAADALVQDELSVAIGRLTGALVLDEFDWAGTNRNHSTAEFIALVEAL